MKGYKKPIPEHIKAIGRKIYIDPKSYHITLNNDFIPIRNSFVYFESVLNKLDLGNDWDWDQCQREATSLIQQLEKYLTLKRRSTRKPRKKNRSE